MISHYFDEHTNLFIGYEIYNGQPTVDLNNTYYADTKKHPTCQQFGLRSESALVRHLEEIILDFLDNETEYYNGDVNFDSKELVYWHERIY